MCDVIKIITSSLYFVVDNQVHYIRNIMFYITTYAKNTELLQIFQTHFIFFFNHYMLIDLILGLINVSCHAIFCIDLMAQRAIK